MVAGQKHNDNQTFLDMKRLLFFFAILAGCLMVQGQNSTIVDTFENHVEVQHDFGDYDTIARGKGVSANIEVVLHKGQVYVMTGKNWSPGAITGIPSYKPFDFGYSTPRELFDFLVCFYFEEYSVHTCTDSDGNVDTIKYYNGDSLMYAVPYSNQGDTLIIKGQAISQ